jgi:hypothetical protein
MTEQELLQTPVKELTEQQRKKGVKILLNKLEQEAEA